MKTRRTPRRPAGFPETFLPQRVASAADRAMEEVLEEDRLLREHGIVPQSGRSR